MFIQSFNPLVVVVRPTLLIFNLEMEEPEGICLFYELDLDPDLDPELGNDDDKSTLESPKGGVHVQQGRKRILQIEQRFTQTDTGSVIWFASVQN